MILGGGAFDQGILKLITFKTLGNSVNKFCFDFYRFKLSCIFLS